MTREYLRKVLFSYFFPYGITSPEALSLGIRMNPTAYESYSPSTTAESRFKSCNSTHLYCLERIGLLTRGGYITDTTLKFGKNRGEKFHAVRLERPGFYLLTGTPDLKLELQRLNFAYDSKRPVDRNKKEISYYPSLDMRNLHQLLYDIDSNPDKTAQDLALFEQIFSEAVSTWELTPLANSIALAAETQIRLKRSNSTQQFRMWQESNAIAMFRANNFLTYLDRRPIDTGWAINGIASEQQYQRRKESGTLDIPAFMFHSLRKWYFEHPDSYLFTAPDLSLSEHYEEWKNTPAFYAKYEIPGFERLYLGEFEAKAGRQNVLRSTFLGLGIGARSNYIFYHYKPTTKSWNTGIERVTKRIVERSIDSYNEHTPIPGAKREINDAILLCCSTLQFGSLFSKVRKKATITQRANAVKFGYPYRSLSIVPINASGVMQLRTLMLSTPDLIIRTTVREMITKHPEFYDVNDTVYPLGYKNKPVFIAYNLEYYSLCRAVNDYHDGKEFYVLCYPEQVSYIRRIMPEVKIL